MKTPFTCLFLVMAVAIAGCGEETTTPTADSADPAIETQTHTTMKPATPATDPARPVEAAEPAITGEPGDTAELGAQAQPVDATNPVDDQPVQNKAETNKPAEDKTESEPAKTRDVP